MSIPNLTYAPETKVGLETLIYYNPDIGYMTKHGNGSSGLVNVQDCAGNNNSIHCPTGSFDATVNMRKNESAIGSIPIASPLFRAVEGESVPTGANDYAQVWCLPDPTNDVLICMDQGFSVTPGEQWRAVPRKRMPVDHYVPQVNQHSVSMSDLFVTNWAGCQAINNIPVTLIVHVVIQGTNLIQEVQYYPNSLMNFPTMNSPSGANDSIETASASGTCSGILIFSATPP